MIKSLIKDYITDKEIEPGISLALVKEGKCIYKESYGYGNIENKVKATSETNFYLASVSKAFTAASIMLLHQRKSLDVYDNIVDYFPDLPDYYKDIRIINLINHTSGLRDYFKNFLDNNKLYDVKNEDVYNYVLKENLIDFPVGTKFQYSNTGYVLLSMLVEKVSGASFSSFLEDNFFSPLGMKNTFVFTKDKPIIPNRAYGYKKVEGKYYCDDYSILTTGGGGIYSNVDDLVLWDQAFTTEKIFSASTLEKIFSVDKVHTTADTGYGCGWFIRNRDNKKVVFHDGSAFGFRTLFGKSIDDKFTIIMLTNCYKAMWEEIYKRCSYIILELNDYYCKGKHI